MRMAMTSEIIASPAHPEPSAATEPARALVIGRMPGPVSLRPSRPPSEPGDPAKLAAALAQERHVTLELQRAILPLHEGPFDLPGLRAVVRYLPASRDSRVGGDWYITAEMPGGHVLLALGDVAGHGLTAAAGMARLRGALAGLAITGAPPERLVGWLNDLVHHVAPEHTASVVAGYFHPAPREIAAGARGASGPLPRTGSPPAPPLLWGGVSATQRPGCSPGRRRAIPHRCWSGGPGRGRWASRQASCWGPGAGSMKLPPSPWRPGTSCFSTATG